MLLLDIVKRVNAKSFGETDYDYDDIYPYFQEAIDSLNSQLDVHRRIADAPVVYDTALYKSMEYSFLQDIYINNYIVTFIVVAMDNASLSVTSRTQTYAAQLEKFKAQTISDLYKWMPVKTIGGHGAFDLTGRPGRNELGVPEVKVWYDEKIGGKLSCYGAVAPTRGIRWDNPYGTVILHPKYEGYKLKLGPNKIPYIFIPNDYFKQYYKETLVYAIVHGHNVEYIPGTYENITLDIGARDGLDEVLLAAWTRLKDNNGRPIVDGPSMVSGMYEDGAELVTVLVMQSDNGVYFLDTENKNFYFATPTDLKADPVVFSKTVVIKSTLVTDGDTPLAGLDISLYATEQALVDGDIVVAESGKAAKDALGRYIDRTYATQEYLSSVINKFLDGSYTVHSATRDGKGNVITDTYATVEFVKNLPDLEDTVSDIEAKLTKILDGADEDYDTFIELANQVAKFKEEHEDFYDYIEALTTDTAIDTKTTDINQVLFTNTDYTFAADNITSITLEIPSTAVHGYTCGVNFKTSKPIPKFTVNNKSSIPLKYINGGRHVDKVALKENKVYNCIVICNGMDTLFQLVETN
jgi:hypothetical protein